jgi:hypothetical protein
VGVAVPLDLQVDSALLNVDPEILQTVGEMSDGLAELPDGVPLAGDSVSEIAEDVDAGGLLDARVDPRRGGSRS